MEKQNYSFATAISMVVGCVIGSGIFFKADDILLAVNGNVKLGLLGFLIVGLGVLFGALTIAHYVELDTDNEGLIGYSKLAAGRKFGYLVGWFSISCYFPTLMVILALLTTNYIAMLLGINSQLFITVGTFILICSNLVLNLKFPKASGKLQVYTTITKIIPLLLIGLVGALFFSPEVTNQVATTGLTGGHPMSALIAIAFSFDGWIVATNIADDLEDSKRNLPRALALGAVAIMAIYSLYFYGLTRILDPSQIVALGDTHIQVAAQLLVGDIGANLILVFVIISVYGGFNGMTMAFVRLPMEMVDLGLLKVPEKYKANQFGYSIKMIIVITFGWFIFEQLIDYKLIFTNLAAPFDISAMPILSIYLIYIVLFIAVNKLVKDKSNLSRLYFLIISCLAVISALMIIVGTLAVNGLLYIVISSLVMLIGIIFYNSKSCD